MLTILIQVIAFTKLPRSIRKRFKTWPPTLMLVARGPDASDTDATTAATQPDCSDCTDTEEEVSVDPGEAYKEIKALGDADRKVCLHGSSQIICCLLILFQILKMHVKSKDQHTANIRTIFTKTMDYIHLGTGNMVTRHYCLVCKYVFLSQCVSEYH
jgi:hypothetical protein